MIQAKLNKKNHKINVIFMSSKGKEYGKNVNKVMTNENEEQRTIQSEYLRQQELQQVKNKSEEQFGSKINSNQN